MNMVRSSDDCRERCQDSFHLNEESNVMPLLCKIYFYICLCHYTPAIFYKTVRVPVFGSLCTHAGIHGRHDSVCNVRVNPSCCWSSSRRLQDRHSYNHPLPHRAIQGHPCHPQGARAGVRGPNRTRRCAGYLQILQNGMASASQREHTDVSDQSVVFAPSVMHKCSVDRDAKIISINWSREAAVPVLTTSDGYYIFTRLVVTTLLIALHVFLPVTVCSYDNLSNLA